MACRFPTESAAPRNGRAQRHIGPISYDELQKSAANHNRITAFEDVIPGSRRQMLRSGSLSGATMSQDDEGDMSVVPRPLATEHYIARGPKAVAVQRGTDLATIGEGGSIQGS